MEILEKILPAVSIEDMARAIKEVIKDNKFEPAIRCLLNEGTVFIPYEEISDFLKECDKYNLHPSGGIMLETKQCFYIN